MKNNCALDKKEDKEAARICDWYDYQGHPPPPLEFLNEEMEKSYREKTYMEHQAQSKKNIHLEACKYCYNHPCFVDKNKKMISEEIDKSI